ncbi:MAG: lysylphosphatidylglycerol synthase domain-containing protein [bacterium]
MKKNIISFIFLVTLLAIVYIYIEEKIYILLKVSYLEILFSILFALSLHFFSGIQYYFIRKQFGVSLKKKDVFFLPSVMGLWSFIMPFQGSLIFTTYFFKKKYNMKISESLSINIYLYLITLFFTGLFLLIFLFTSNNYNTLLIIISILLIINPILVKFTRILLDKTNISKHKIVNKIRSFVISVFSSTNFLWSNTRFTIIILSTYIIKLIISIFWFYYIAHILSFNMSLFEIALISLIMSVSVIIKLTPGNLGTVQIISGGFMALINSSVENAILITLFASATVLLINFTIGVIGNFYFFKTLNIFNIK